LAGGTGERNIGTINVEISFGAGAIAAVRTSAQSAGRGSGENTAHGVNARIVAAMLSARSEGAINTAGVIRVVALFSFGDIDYAVTTASGRKIASKVTSARGGIAVGDDTVTRRCTRNVGSIANATKALAIVITLIGARRAGCSVRGVLYNTRGVLAHIVLAAKVAGTSST
jgi:hypothetical protein